ncbi:AEC family transporter [Paenactinomyces guangxiensis]|uniref:AEC family transporter n=1 Tax=Paenactinomyces guangxiensis TaxID=1490290 RepID=A0A7W1WPC2_9BACL|nr:AEC family transporter [Paenactinomyces guangxiensis]MBA4493454.1 AEC family transporter [Paenactinomyces guangxiensis]MBH8590545.1 AEC family transporter [Paenactinomyces guangxiensis]
MAFLGVLLPIFFIFGIGYIGQKWIRFETKTLSKMALNLMSPFLVFRTFYHNELTIDYLYIFLYTFLLCFSLIAVVYLIGWLKRYSAQETCGIVLASAFMNNGNYGTPLVLFVYGTAGLHYAIVLMVIQQLVMCTVGVYYAAKGSVHVSGFQEVLRQVVRMPIVYGAMCGIIFQLFSIPLSKPMLQSINLVADATIPTIMIILGMQLAKITVKRLSWEKLSLSLMIRLCLSPIIAFVLTLIFPIPDLLKKIMILMAAMPTAANTTMYAIQYETEPEFVSGATLLSTNFSLVTLPVILLLLS